MSSGRTLNILALDILPLVRYNAGATKRKQKQGVSMIKWNVEALRGRVSPIPGIAEISRESGVSRTTLYRMRDGEPNIGTIQIANDLLAFFSQHIEGLSIGDVIEWVPDEHKGEKK